MSHTCYDYSSQRWFKRAVSLAVYVCGCPYCTFSYIVGWPVKLHERLKVVWTPQLFTLMTWKCVSGHSGVHFFDIWTSKSGPNIWCLYHFDLEMCFAPQRRALFRLGNVLRATGACTFSSSELPKVVRAWWFCTFGLEMCFAPQRRALFRHLSFQKWSETVCFIHFALEMCFAPQRCTFSTSQLPKVVWVRVFYTFCLGNVLRATAACTCSSLVWPDGSAPAALGRLLFGPPEPQIIGKTQWIATLLPFRAPASSSFSLFLLSDLLFSSLLLSDSSHLYFSNCPYCRKFDF